MNKIWAELTDKERETYIKAYEKSKAYWNKRDRLLNQRFNKTSKQVLKELKTEYNRIWKEIESEINGWYARNITDPNFKWSELKSLEDTQRAIGLLLDELYDIEKNKLGEAMDDVYVSTYQDQMALTQSYFNGLNRVVPTTENIMLGMMEQTNRVASMSGLEQMLRKEIDVAFLSKRIWDKDDILKHPLEWYKGFAKGTFTSRIERRRAIVKNEINQVIRNAYIKGSSVDKATKDIMDRLNPHGLDDLCEDVKKKLQTSYSNAKRLAHNELAYAQHCADSKQMKDNGFKGVKRKTVKDNKVCPICKEHEGEIIPIEQYEANPSVMMLHVGCRDYGVPVMSMDGNNPFKAFAEKYDKEQK